MDPAPFPFDRLRARVLLPSLLVTLAVSAQFQVVSAGPGPEDEARRLLSDGLGMLLGYVLAVAVIGVLARRAGVRLPHLYGRRPSLRRLARVASLGVPLVGLAMVGIYVLYAPLSLVAPGFVTWWVLDDVTHYLPGPPYPWLANGLTLLAGVVAAPLVEEWVFRGLLLRRWTRKWGVVPAVVTSSVVFALLHVDLVGSFLFSVVMCALCDRFRSLWAPTVAHAANNVLAFGLGALDAHGGLPLPAVDTVEQLRVAIWMPVVGLALCLPWLIALRGEVRPMATWRFAPDGAPDAATDIAPEAPPLSPGAARSAAP